MAFERILVRTADGQEYGPASQDDLRNWHREGRVPANAVVIDCATREEQPVSAILPAAAVPPPPMSPQQVQSAPTATDHLIPTKNPKALVAYYCGVFGLACAFPLGAVALILGIMGFRASATLGVGRTHALVGIIMGSLETLVVLAAAIMIAVSVTRS